MFSPAVYSDHQHRRLGLATDDAEGYFGEHGNQINQTVDVIVVRQPTRRLPRVANYGKREKNLARDTERSLMA